MRAFAAGFATCLGLLTAWCWHLDRIERARAARAVAFDMQFPSLLERVMFPRR